MFVTKNQFYVFIACIAFGGCSGIILSIVNFFASLTKNKALKFVFSILAMSIIGIIFSTYSHRLFFPNVRVYMIVGVLTGIYLYYKSFYIILAKLVKKFYNICKRKIKKIKGKGYDRIKSKKNDSGNHGRRSIVASNIAVNNGLSDDINSNGKKPYRAFKRTN